MLHSDISDTSVFSSEINKRLND